jgi:L-galactono-1,4-lactone dehydrogenase
VGDEEEEHEEHTVTNWSGTHEARTKVYIQPESLEELEVVVKLANDRKQRIRPVGSGLSPNGLGLSDEGMVNLALMDRILSVDQDTKRVTVQAGARVEQVVAALRSHGLTLQNFASIKEQQIGGFIQVQKSIKDFSSYCKTLINPNEP